MIDNKLGTAQIQTDSVCMCDDGVETIMCDDVIIAIILRANFKKEGICFFSPNNFSQQLGYMHHPQDHCIVPHAHNPVSRTIEWTQEALFVRSGTVRLDLYAPNDRSYAGSRVLRAGDVVMLAHGGHGFKMLEDAEMVEIKQGPYAGVADKTCFAPVADEDVRLQM